MPRRTKPTSERTDEAPAGGTPRPLVSSSDDAELHRLLVESVSDYAIYALDRAGRVRTWNAGAEQITGFSAPETLGRPFSIFFTEEDVGAGEPARELEITIRDDRYEGEGWRLRKGGTRFWAHVVLRPLRDERGETIGFAKVTRDLTIPRTLTERTRQLEAESAAREQAEERRHELERVNEKLRRQRIEMEVQAADAQALAEELEEQTTELEAANRKLTAAVREREAAHRVAIDSEMRYRLLFDANPLPTWVYDSETLRFLAVNDAAVRQYGYSREEFLAMTIEQIRPPEDVAALRLSLRKVPREPLRGGSWRHRRKDGGIVDVDVVGTAIEFAGRSAELALVHDVTQRRRTEVELHESMSVLRAIVENSPVAIIVLDNDLRITRWNPSAERMFGWSSDEMLGQPYAGIIPEEKLKEHLRLQDEVLRGEVVTNFETQRRRSDGSLVDVILSVAVMRGPDGPSRGFAVLVADVTERRKLEMQFRQALKMEAVGQLAGGVAHDFNNLLTVITSYSGLLLAQLPGDDPMRSDIEQIGNAANRAAALTRQLLAFSRQQILRPRVLTFNEVVTGLQSLLRRLVRENIEITTSLDPQAGLVEADPGQIEQVIVNLVVNARDAMPDGGTLMIATTNAVFDDVYLFRHEGVYMPPGNYALLSISDTGTGMTPEVQARAFDPFYTTKAPGEGTGLGLATVYGIVKQSGGYIWLYSEPGQGTTFKIYLPLVAKAAEVAVRERDHALPLGGSETILLVEDDAVLRAVACRAIRAYGYNVLEASNGSEALEICERHGDPIQLVVTDVVMPGMSGGDLARQLAEHHPGIKVLLMSGYMRDAAVRQSIVRDGGAFLEKPFTPDVLVGRIREVLDGGSTAASD